MGAVQRLGMAIFYMKFILSRKQDTIASGINNLEAIIQILRI